MKPIFYFSLLLDFLLLLSIVDLSKGVQPTVKHKFSNATLRKARANSKDVTFWISIKSKAEDTSTIGTPHEDDQGNIFEKQVRLSRDLKDAEIVLGNTFDRIKHFVQKKFATIKRIVRAAWPWLKETFSSFSNFKANLRNPAIIFFFLLHTFICSCVYWGFASIQNILYKRGAYVNKCGGEFDRVFDADGIFYNACASQQSAINQLYNRAFISHFVASGLLGGLSNDLLGPKATALIGLCLSVAAWEFLATASLEMEWMYTAFAIFIGLATEFNNLPTLSARYLFTNHGESVVGALGALSSLSFSIPKFIWLVYKPRPAEDLQTPIVSYIGGGLGTSFLISFLLIPWVTFGDRNFSAISWIMKKFRRKKEEYRADTAESTATTSRDSGARRHSENGNSDFEMTTIDEREKTNKIPQNKKKPWWQTFGSELPDFWGEIRQMKFWGLLAYYAVDLMKAESFVKAQKEFLHTENGHLYRFFDIVNILTAFPCYFLGVASNNFGALNVFQWRNITGAMMYLTVLSKNAWASSFAIGCYFLFASYPISNNYSYIGQNFPKKYHGILCGIVAAFAGISTLASQQLYEYCAFSIKNFWSLNATFVVLSLVSFVIGYKMQRQLDAEKKTKLVDEATNKFMNETADVRKNLFQVKKNLDLIMPHLENLMQQQEDAVNHILTKAKSRPGTSTQDPSENE